MYFVYILQSEARKTFYIGSCVDVTKRLKQHNSGHTKSTKRYRPWKLIYTEKYKTKPEANKREWHLKHRPGYLEKRSIIEQYSVVNGGVA